MSKGKKNTEQKVPEATERKVEAGTRTPLTKLSIKGIVGKPSIGQVVDIAGIVRGAEAKTTQYGECMCFKGNFTAVFKGALFTGRKAYLPQSATEALESLGDKYPVEFAIRVTCVADPRPDSKKGYAFTTEFIGKAQAAEDPSEKLLRAAGSIK